MQFFFFRNLHSAWVETRRDLGAVQSLSADCRCSNVTMFRRDNQSKESDVC